MVKAMKKQKTIFIFLKLILLLVLIVFSYFQFKKVNWSNQTIYLENPFFLLFVLLLVPLNWFFEWRKWRLTLSVADIDIVDCRCVCQTSEQNTCFFCWNCYRNVDAKHAR